MTSFTGKILRVNLSTGTTEAVNVPPEVYEAVIVLLITEIQSVSELWQVWVEPALLGMEPLKSSKSAYRG